MRPIRLPLCILLAALPGAARAQGTNADVTTEPKWEAGVFLGLARLPLYKGSAENRVYPLPVPYLIYRGDVVQSDRDGVRGVLFNSARFESTVSISGHPPVDGAEGPREGMPDLPPLLEAGPALKWWPVGKRENWSFNVRLAVRATASVDADDGLATRYEGWRSELSAVFSRYLADPRWRLGTSVSAEVGSVDYHRFYYDVPEAYAAADRSAYDAAAGYGGLGWAVFVTRKQSRKLTTGLYARWDNIAGAVFADSPLVELENTFMFGAAAVWQFAESKARVQREADRDAR